MSPASKGPEATTIEAQKIQSTPDRQTVAEGNAELRREDATIQADTLTYDQATAIARAVGSVVVKKKGDTYKGPLLQIKLDTYEGFFLSPTYVLGQTGAAGSAERIDFLSKDRAVGLQATYSTCTPDNLNQLDWVISAKRLTVDFTKNEGLAEGAVLRFLGVPILATPVISFPLTSERKTGWLPPSIEIDSRSGLQLSVPFYWNIAPNMDATLAPELITRRGTGLNSEFRYLEPGYQGTVKLNWLGSDKLAGTSRYGLNLKHTGSPRVNTQMDLQVMRVSDDDYWKDFPKGVGSLTPRLLMSDLGVNHLGSQWITYARLQSWQVLQSVVSGEDLDAPYQRTPQLGARTQRFWDNGLRLDFEGEFNHFNSPAGTSAAHTPTGSRLHSVASISLPWVMPAWTITPKLSLNAASYAMDAPLASGPYAGKRSLTRIIPTASIDSRWVLERSSRWFDNDIRQTLEPRLVYANTPYKDQTGLPNFDAAAKDFNFDSIQSAESQFTGIDRVADAHQITGSLSTRFINPEDGGELLRVGVAQRYLFKDQRITPDGTPLSQRFSDLFFMGSTGIVPHWYLSSTAQYSPELSKIQRFMASAIFQPGPQRTLGVSYTSDRVGLSDQLALGWQWPVYGPPSHAARPLFMSPANGASGACQGTWYSVGRLNYNPQESKVVDSIVGLEYDAGCWITRVVARRQSTGLKEYITGVGIQLELVGLSRLGFGSNPIQLLKENVGGYQPLRN